MNIPVALDTVSHSVGTDENLKKEPGFRLGYLPALDGLRGVAILLVLVTHLELAPDMYGFIGVDVFFVLSGFLITCLLIEEWDETGRISFRAFYARRALRLLPALVAMVAAFLVYSRLCHTPGMQAWELKEALFALFYSTNWTDALHLSWSSFLGHTWSLSIEEQFYLIWPVTLLVLLRRTKRNSLTNFLLLGAILSCLERFLLYSGTAAAPHRLSRGLDTRADALLIGCAIGVAISSGWTVRSVWARRALRFSPVVAAAAFGIMSQMSNPESAFMIYAGWFVIAALSGTLILHLLTEPGGIFARVLNSRPLVWVGRISYGLYLWHYPIFLALSEAGFKPEAKYWYVRLAAAGTATVASYYLIERPFLRLKRRFQKAS